jgi:hypothetical protein
MIPVELTDYKGRSNSLSIRWRRNWSSGVDFSFYKNTYR